VPAGSELVNVRVRAEPDRLNATYPAEPRPNAIWLAAPDHQLVTAVPATVLWKPTRLAVVRQRCSHAQPLPQDTAVVMTANSVTTTKPNDMLVFVGAVGDLGGAAVGSFTQQLGFTSISDLQNGNQALTVAYVTQATAGASGNVTCTWDNNNFGQSGSVLLALSPA